MTSRWDRSRACSIWRVARARCRAGHGSALLATALVAAALAAPNGSAQESEEPAPPASLKTVPVPGPSAAELAEYVADKAAAIRLGKALFWDTRVGSDNRTACATCHASAGLPFLRPVIPATPPAAILDFTPAK